MSDDMNEFRVYDKKEGCYLDCNKAPMLGMNGELFFHQKGATWVTSEDPNRYEYEPSIQRKDIDNNLIYAGDLIECSGNNPGVYLVHPNNVLTNFNSHDCIKYYLDDDTWKPRVIGNIHDKSIQDATLSQIYVVVKDWQGLFQWLLDWGWSIDDLLKYENGNDLFHDIVKNERQSSTQWYTDYFDGDYYNDWSDGDTVYIDSYGEIVNEDNPDAIKCTLRIIDRFDCRKLLDSVKYLYEESGK